MAKIVQLSVLCLTLFISDKCFDFMVSLTQSRQIFIIADRCICNADFWITPIGTQSKYRFKDVVYCNSFLDACAVYVNALFALSTQSFELHFEPQFHFMLCWSLSRPFIAIILEHYRNANQRYSTNADTAARVHSNIMQNKPTVPLPSLNSHLAIIN